MVLLSFSAVLVREVVCGQVEDDFGLGEEGRDDFFDVGGEQVWEGEGDWEEEECREEREEREDIFLLGCGELNSTRSEIGEGGVVVVDGEFDGSISVGDFFPLPSL